MTLLGYSVPETITDDAGNALKGVAVAVTGPSAYSGTVTSDATTGVLQLGPLPPGDYTVTLNGRSAVVPVIASAADIIAAAAAAAPALAPVQTVAGRTGAVVLAKADVGLGSVDDTADSAKPVSTQQQAALDLKANLASPALTGNPTAPTQTAGNNSTRLATTAYADSAVAAEQTRAAAAYRPLDLSTIVLWGDSHWENGGGDGAQSSATARLTRARAAWPWALATLKQRGRVVHNGGVGGERSDQIVARYAADVAPYAPGIVLMDAGTNDVAQLVTSTVGTVATTVAAVQANVTSMIAQARAGGAQVVICTIPNIWSNWITNQVSAANQINRWIKSLPLTTRGVVVCDWSRKCVDSTGLWISGMNFDTAHAGPKGAARMGAELAAALDRLLPVGDVLPPWDDTYNLVTNGFQTGTTGSKGTGITGNVAAGWTAAAFGGTCTAVGSKVTRTDLPGLEWQQYAISAVGGGTQGVRHYASLDTGEFATGDTVYALVEFETDSDLTMATLSDFYVELGFTDGTAVAQSIKNANAESLNDPACRLSSGVLRTWPLLLPDITAKTLRVGLYCLGATGTIRIGRIAVYKVGAYSG